MAKAVTAVWVLSLARELPYATGALKKKINSEWIKDLKVRAKTVNLLEENMGSDLCDRGLSNGFLAMTPNDK